MTWPVWYLQTSITVTFRKRKYWWRIIFECIKEQQEFTSKRKHAMIVTHKMWVALAWITEFWSFQVCHLLHANKNIVAEVVNFNKVRKGKNMKKEKWKKHLE